MIFDQAFDARTTPATRVQLNVIEQTRQDLEIRPGQLKYFCRRQFDKQLSELTMTEASNLPGYMRTYSVREWRDYPDEDFPRRTARKAAP